MFRKVRESVLKTGWSLGLYTPPDRRVLEEALRAFAARADVRRVLFVGVKAYNRHLKDLFVGPSSLGGEGRTFATIDPVPEFAEFGGSPHFVDVLENLDRHVEAESFELVVMNGVIGFGLNDPANVERALTQVHRALVPGGELFLGINERIPTHVALTGVEAMRLFSPKPFALFGAPRQVIETPFREETHTFELWERPRAPA